MMIEYQMIISNESQHPSKNKDKKTNSRKRNQDISP